MKMAEVLAIMSEDEFKLVNTVPPKGKRLLLKLNLCACRLRTDDRTLRQLEEDLRNGKIKASLATNSPALKEMLRQMNAENSSAYAELNHLLIDVVGYVLEHSRVDKRRV
jgi:hypothetical protein